MTELNSLRKGTSLHLKCTADAPTLPVEQFGQPHPSEFIHEGGSDYHAELGLLEHVSQRRPGMGCVATSWWGRGGETLFSPAN